jgi:SAM-dependent methyltransferase
VAALVPAGARRVLDVGCGGGELGRLLKRRGHYVAGIELVPAAAERARTILDQVACFDLETDPPPFSPGSFDAIILADVLEHLIDPWRVLKQLVRLLSPGGRVIASVPNLQNWKVLRRLLVGRWRYRERGITDFAICVFLHCKHCASCSAMPGWRSRTSASTIALVGSERSAAG